MGPVLFARFADYRDCGINRIMSSSNIGKNCTFKKPLNPYKKESISKNDIIRTPEKAVDAKDEESLEEHQ